MSAITHTTERMPAGLRVVRSVAELRATVAGWRRGGHSVGVVPTMGAIHAGHLALVRQAAADCDRVICTLFVNPKQFSPSEDFLRYPRDEAGDAAKFASAGAHLVFAPEVETMYPPGHQTSVIVRGVTAPLEGVARPHHFEGVATVVAKLLLQCLGDAAYFGEKDYQQLRTITRMAADLDIPTRIVPVPTVREADGMALSSRNAYLSPEERRRAPVLHRTLEDVAERIGAGQIPAAAAAWGIDVLSEAGFGPIDYLGVADAETLEPLSVFDRPARILVAAWLGQTRLIDNIPATPAR